MDKFLGITGIIICIIMLGLLMLMVNASTPPASLEQRVSKLEEIVGLKEPHKLIIPDWGKRK
jgi:hypothetical protein